MALTTGLTDFDSKYGGRRTVDTQAIQSRCDMLVLTGGVVSPHMREHVRKARQLGQPIVDLTPFGVRPPSPNEDDAIRIQQIVKRAVVTRPRRVWMPLLTQDDFKVLQSARHALYSTPGGYDVEVELLDRIISAVDDTSPI
jgi:hypothetical protein